MGRQEWTGRSRLRQFWWVLLAIVAGTVIMSRHAGTSMQKGFSVFGQPGYVVPRSQIAGLQQTASYLRVFPRLGGLSLSAAMTHPMGLNASSSIELLYGNISSGYLDLVESSYALRTSTPSTLETVGSLAVHVGDAKLGGKRRHYAYGRLGSGYFMLVGPNGGKAFTAALQEIAAKT